MTPTPSRRGFASMDFENRGFIPGLTAPTGDALKTRPDDDFSTCGGCGVSLLADAADLTRKWTGFVLCPACAEAVCEGMVGQ